jgi:hypothetical protein
MSLSPEKEKEIRDYTKRVILHHNTPSEPVNYYWIPDLLEEIDRLRDQANVIKKWQDAEYELEKVIKERDQLKAVIKTYQQASKDMAGGYIKLKEENEKLKESSVLCPACGTDWQLQTIIDARKTICEENQQLRDRIGKLRKAAKVMLSQELNGVDCDAIEGLQQALAQDDEAEK